MHGSLRTSRDWPASENTNRKLPPCYLNSFRCNDLNTATRKFSARNLLGQGGFGDVYKGYIDLYTMKAAKPESGCPVALKKLRRRGAQGHKEWLNELRFLSRLNHPNIVTLIGYCYEDEQRVLAYEYACKGSLEAHRLSGHGTELNWSERIKIDIGAAKALDYLHHAYSKPVIHHHLKASNVPLDADFNPILSDFGMTIWEPGEGKSHITSSFLGTRGHFAPEYFTLVKTDVYSFGVVLLETLLGSAAVRMFSDGRAGDLADWAKPYLSDRMKLHYIIDKKIARSVQIEEANKFAKIISQCLSLDPRSRPTISEVLSDLEKLQQDMVTCNLNLIRPLTYTQ